MDPRWKSLEWDKIVGGAAELARSEPAKTRVLSLLTEAHWASSRESAVKLQEETREILGFLDRNALWGPLTGLRDPEPILESLSRDGVLDLPSIVEIRRWMEASEAWTEFPHEDLHRAPVLAKSVASLPDFKRDLRPLERAILANGEISESASPKYKKLSEEIHALQDQVTRELESLRNRYSIEGVLQEEFTDVRDEKYVLPVRVSLQSKVEGVIVDSSVSKQTVFIEPREIAPLSKRLRLARSELLEEAFRILKELSEGLSPALPQIHQAVSELIRWDVVQAKARYGKSYGGKTIEVSKNREFKLRGSAHPLLWLSLEEKKIERNDFDIEDPARVLLITGPNTGGKTVFLKCLGLAAICARTGFLFPGAGVISVPFFKRVFVDVGDPQSIEEHLSSFSGHIAKLRSILEEALDDSLVLIDELGTATDPEEGSALSRAFLEELLTRSSPLIVATSHDPGLKALALSDDRILSASMEFNEESYTPTYRLKFGIPGRSRAIEIAEHLGLPSSVIARARSFLSESHHRMEGLFSKLESEFAQARHARVEAESVLAQAEKMREEWTTRAQTSVGELVEKMRSRLKQVITQAEEEIRDSVKRIEGSRSIRDGFQKAEILRQKLALETASAIQSLEKAIGSEAKESLPEFQMPSAIETPIYQEYELGEIVRVPKWKNFGKILETKAGKAKVALGDPRDSKLRPITMNLSITELESLSEEEKAKFHARKSQPVRTEMSEGASGGVSREIDLRGERLDDAMKSLEKSLEHSYLGGAQEARIIHGLGTGALKQGTHALLRGLPYIEHFRDGGPGEGGAGCTVVIFAKR